jgi:hypothetical protein
MAKPRKKWSTTRGPDAPSQADLNRRRHTSEQKAFDQVQADAADYAAGRHGYSYTDVWVDEGGSYGWQWSERVEHKREET